MILLILNLIHADSGIFTTIAVKTAKMDYRFLGKSGLLVSRIGFGCMSLEQHETENKRLLLAAIEKGINFFDTADLYAQGNNEVTVGNALKQKRKDVIIATKVGNQLKKDGSGWLWNPRKEYIMGAVNSSLQRLQTDYIDLYQLHGGTINDDMDEAIDAFTVLQQQGKIRYYGISSIRPNVIRSYVYRSAACSVMMQYSLLDRRAEESCFSLLSGNHIGVLARGCLAGGLLVNKAAKPYLNHSEHMVKKAADAIAALSDETRNSTATALQFVLQQPAISSAVVGIRTMSQLENAVATLSADPLEENEIAVLQQSVPVNYYAEHR